jgi:hypothetical protein
MTKKTFILVLFLGIGLSAYSQPKEFYTTVDLIIWVVNDAHAVAEGWKNIGFKSIKDQGRINLNKLTYKSEVTETEIHLYTGYLGGARILWIQPIRGNSAFSEFLRKNGNGVFALLHDVPLQVELAEEVQRLNNLGVKVLQDGQVMVENQPLRMTYMQTSKKGKYVIGFLNGTTPVFENYKINNDLDMKFNQFAFAIKESSTNKVSAYWEGLGFPAMQITHGETWGKQYYGEPADFDMKLGWYRYGDITYEWCIPLKAPTVYEDHIKKYGEGFQHLGFSVPDIDKAIQYFEKRGFRISMSGGWGEKGKAGSGRFAYVNTEEIGGETIELLWSYSE